MPMSMPTMEDRMIVLGYLNVVRIPAVVSL
jgi:hypothetical protein